MSVEPHSEALLEPDEQLVLFELLQRWIGEERGASIRAAIIDDAELWALNTLNGELERLLAAPFESSYVPLLEAARGRLRAKNGGQWPR